MAESDPRTPERGRPPAAGPGPQASREDPAREHWLAPFFQDSALWPVLAVVTAIFTVLGAWALLLAAVDHNLAALAAVALLFWISVDAVFRSRRRAGGALLAACIAALWLLSIAAALLARHAGWY